MSSPTLSPTTATAPKSDWPLTYEEAAALLLPRISTLLAPPPKFHRFRGDISMMNPNQLEGILKAILKEVTPRENYFDEVDPEHREKKIESRLLHALGILRGRICGSGSPYIAAMMNNNGMVDAPIRGGGGVNYPVNQELDDDLGVGELDALGELDEILGLSEEDKRRMRKGLTDMMSTDGMVDPPGEVNLPVNQGLDDPTFEKVSEDSKRDLRNMMLHQDINWNHPSAPTKQCLDQLKEVVVAFSKATPSEIAEKTPLLKEFPNDAKKDNSKKVLARRVIGVLIAAKMKELWADKFGEDEARKFPSGVPLLGNDEVDAATAAVYFGKPDYPLIRRELQGMKILCEHGHEHKGMRRFEVRLDTINTILKEVKDSSV